MIQILAPNLGSVCWITIVCGGFDVLRTWFGSGPVGLFMNHSPYTYHASLKWSLIRNFFTTRIFHRGCFRDPVSFARWVFSKKSAHSDYLPRSHGDMQKKKMCSRLIALLNECEEMKDCNNSAIWNKPITWDWAVSFQLQEKTLTFRAESWSLFLRIRLPLGRSVAKNCKTADQQIYDVSLYLRVSCVSVVKTFINNPS